MENDERCTRNGEAELPAPPAALAGSEKASLVLLDDGKTPVWRCPRGILRAGPRALIEAQHRGVIELQRRFPALADQAPRVLHPPVDHGGLAWMLEQDLGIIDSDPLDRIARWTPHFLEAQAETVHLDGSLRDSLRRLVPQGLPRSSRLIAALRAARAQGAELPFPPKLASLERALDSTVDLVLTRSWAHGATRPARMLQGGACHWRHLAPGRWLGQDQAPFLEPDARDPAGALLALAYGWRWDPLRAADALIAMGLVDPAPPRWVELSLAEPHPCLDAGGLARLLGVSPGRVPAVDAARALGRAQGFVLAGIPLRLDCSPPVRPRRNAAPWRIRDRDPRRLFGRWHEGIALDAEARASLSPEAPAMDTARALRAERVVDAFCGAGGNAIALARMPWCRQVVAVELDPERLAMARHNAGIYGVLDRIRFVQGDFFALAPSLASQAQACFLDPPWDKGTDFASRAWSLARGLFPSGAMKQPRQWPAPPDADRLEAVFGQGPVVSWVQAWWGATRTAR
jgi:hypothetical protein